MKQVTVQAPASIANFVCGFDILGFAISEPLDTLVIRQNNSGKVTIVNEDGFGLPENPADNVSGAALLAMLAKLDDNTGFEVLSRKQIKPGSGIGSSAASAVAAVVGANALLEGKFSDTELIDFALSGEFVASGARHADNVAPCLFGGINLIRSNDGPDIVALVGPKLYVTVVHPQIEVLTSKARSMLKPEVPLKDAIEQWGNIAGLVAGLMKNDYGLISRSLQDVIVEPVRKVLIPQFDEIKKRSLQNGALGGGISGSGPSVFMLSTNEGTARLVEAAMSEIYLAAGINFKTYVTTISESGARVIDLQTIE